MRTISGLGVVLVLVGMALFTGCATITKGTSQEISISSNVDGATLYLDGEMIGKTPFYGKVKKNKKLITVELDGYKTETIALSKGLTGMFWGNIITGGTTGSITDFASGAAYEYSPATYQVDLKSDTQSSLEYEQQLAVRKFSMIYIDQISLDLVAGEGEYLSAIIEILDAQDNSTATTDRIRAAMESSGGDQVSFGEAMVNLI